MRTEPRSPLERFIQDPSAPGILMMAALVIGGFVAIWFGWRGVARTIHVALQVPGLLSGGVAGVALIGLGSALVNVQVGRRDAAEERRRTDRVLDEVAALQAFAPRLGRAIMRRRALRKRERAAPPRTARRRRKAAVRTSPRRR